jgi:D-3-phosphoglycerate dehydrogenase
MKEKVLVSVPNFKTRCQRAVGILEEEKFEVIEYNGNSVMTTEEIKSVGFDIFGSIVGTDEWTEEIFDSCPKIKIIARFGVGYNNIDIEGAKKRGIKVTTARGINSDSVAECTIMFALTLLRNLINLDQTTKKGDWIRYNGHTLKGKVYGLVGFGAIAQNVAKILSSFGTKEILAYDVFQNHDMAKKLNVEFVDLDRLLEESDIISLHIPSTKETDRLIGTNLLKKMKNTAILINMARGSVVDEKALYTALKERQIAGAGLDVFETEPTNKDCPLFSLDNVVVMPHLAADTHEAFEAVSCFCAQSIVDVHNGKIPENWINK